MTRVLVTGARGKTGRPLSQLLGARSDVEVLGGSSDPAAVVLDGVTPIRFDWDDPTTWTSALDDVDAVYVVRPDRADAPELVEALVDEISAGARVVLLSERRADDVDWSVRTEQVVRDGKHPWTILRPDWFMQVLVDDRFYLGSLVELGELAFPSGGARLAWIDARDIAAVAERALLSDAYESQVLELTGPEAMTLARTTELISEAMRRPVTHREVGIDEAVAGMQGFERELTELTFERVRSGSFSDVTDTVERVTGAPARSLETFLADHQSELRRSPDWS